MARLLLVVLLAAASLGPRASADSPLDCVPPTPSDPVHVLATFVEWSIATLQYWALDGVVGQYPDPGLDPAYAPALYFLRAQGPVVDWAPTAGICFGEAVLPPPPGGIPNFGPAIDAAYNAACGLVRPTIPCSSA